MVKKILDTGVSENNESIENKRVKILNMMCWVWLCINAVFISVELTISPDTRQNLPVLLSSVTLNALTLWLQKVGRYHLARTIYMINLWATTMLFAFLLEPGRQIEYFLMLVAPMALIFFDSKRIGLMLLVVSMLSFLIPQVWMHPNSWMAQAPVAKQALFVSVYVMVNYFRKLNAINEARLAAKVGELEDLRQFQQRFFLNVAHEVRTPLTIISGHQQKITNNGIDATAVKKSGSAIGKEVEKMKRIADDVVLLARLDHQEKALKMTVFDFARTVERNVLACRPLFENKGIDLRIYNHFEAPVLVSGDAVALERVVNNLLMNALKFTDQKGLVTVSLVRKPGGIVALRVEDSGIGIDPEYQELIFDRFYQVENEITQSGGNGIGLAFAKEVIGKHKGQISVESQSNQGSLFTVELPVQKRGSEAHNPVLAELIVENETAQSNNQKHTILLVEDHTEMLDYLQDLLTGYHVLVAKNGEEGLSILSRNSVDLVITDYMMPKMNGLHFVEALRNTEATDGLHTSVIVLSAMSDSDLKVKFITLGIDDFLQKPFNEPELLARVKNCLLNRDSRIRFQQIKEAEEEPLEPSDDWLGEVRMFVDRECSSSQFSVESICEYFALSNSTLFRRIKTATGMNPNGFIREVRLQKAKALCREQKPASAKQLTYSVGLKNTTRFLKQYEERFGEKLSF
ncbi:MAG: response regulator [Roseivirga sp.]|nr:response regulator [Roseivirga sp.]